ncbi:HNH endonuclease [Streptomyces sp. COG21]|nr:HNH endonuclease [Streptomyces sp. COG21]MBT3081896.1 HNH endonuclease [Streptomyces sp. COG20]
MERGLDRPVAASQLLGLVPDAGQSGVRLVVQEQDGRLSGGEPPARLDTDDAWIRARTGIRSRHRAAPGEATSDLAVAAGRRALANSVTQQADAVVVATTTPDRTCPATAPLVAARLGLSGAAAFDVGAVCTGFVYALAAGAGLITSGVADRVLVVGADVYSRIVDPADRQNAVVFGDGAGAGAVVLRAGYADEPGALGSFDLGSDGEHEDMIMVAAGGSRLTVGPGRTSQAERHFAMRGKEVYRHALNRMTESARTALDRSGPERGRRRPVGLEAAHVRWWSHDGPDEVDNGLCLCSLHHKLFDRGVLGLGEDRRILVSQRFVGRSEAGRR